MPYEKTILCLANSRKLGGHCVAGREVAPGGFGPWLRPVSSRQGGEISDEDQRYRDATLPSVLDLIEIRMIAPAPERHQRENHIIDDAYYWVRRGRVAWGDLVNGAVEVLNGPLWLNGHSSTYGANDRVPEDELAQIVRSLYLVRPDKLELTVAEEGGQYGTPQRRVRAAFDVANHPYVLGVTDPVITADFLARPLGRYRVKEALVCISLGEVFHGYAYKLAAAVITPQRAGG